MRICTIEFRTTNPQSEIRNPQLPSRFRCPRAPIAPRWKSRPSCAQPGSCARSSTAPWCDSTGPTSSVGCGGQGKGWSGSIACPRSEEHTSELQSRLHLVCRLLLEKKKNNHSNSIYHALHV